MAQSRFSKLLSKLNVRDLELPNRIIFGSHPTNFAKNNLISEQHVAYYRERAKGGAGMLVLEEQLVHPSDLPYEKALFGYREEIIPGYRQVSEAVHAYGSLVVAQLNHSGMQSEGSTSMRELWAPSAVPDVVSREVPKALETEDIKEVIAGFAKAAGYADAGGIDGIEINAGQFSLLRQFISPLTNQRRDDYGGDLSNRLRLTVEVLLAVRKALGQGKLVGLKLCGDEFAPWAGLTPDDAVKIAAELEQFNLLDYITVTVGSLFSLHLYQAPFYAEEGLAADVAGKIRQKVRLPVFAEGRIHRPQYAAGLVEQGVVDGVCMNRALICDPELPAKLAADREDEVRECLSCNQGCLVRRSMGKPLACMLNPLAGVEAGESKLTPSHAARVKKVLVVGGGPGGMEAAVTAANRGHRVSLWEAGPDLGGDFLAMGTAGVSRVLAYWQTELSEVGVWVVKGKPGTPEGILADKPDVLVLATGARSAGPAFSGVNVRQIPAREALTPVEQGKTVLLWDEIGDQVMARVAERLVAAGNKLYLVTPDFFAGNKLAQTMELSFWNQRVMVPSTEIFTSHKLREINGNTAVIENIFSGITAALPDIDLLVYNSWPKPEDSLYTALKDRVREIYRIGDCLAPRGIGAAIREGYTVGRSI